MFSFWLHACDVWTNIYGYREDSMYKYFIAWSLGRFEDRWAESRALALVALKQREKDQDVYIGYTIKNC